MENMDVYTAQEKFRRIAGIIEGVERETGYPLLRLSLRSIRNNLDGIAETMPLFRSD